MGTKLYFGRLTLYDEEGLIYEIKNTRVTRALEDLNQVLQARGSGVELVSQGMK